MKLSNNAALLLSTLKKGGMWEDKAAEILFSKPEYNRERAAEYWQYEANQYGETCYRPVLGECMEFKPNVQPCYNDIAYKAIKELKDAGLVIAKNNGTNYYSYHYTGK